MELLFIWISKYRNLEKIGFNFSSKYNFNYDYSNGKLNIESNKNFIPDFFLNAENKECNCKIQNITAIIGQNGVGKTAILDFIKYKLISEEIIDLDLIYVIEEKNNIFIKYSSNLDISNINDLKKSKDFKIVLTSIQNSIEYISSDFKNFSMIFFSNIFDNKRINYTTIPNSKLIDISTNFLLSKDREDFKNRNYKNNQKWETDLIKGVNPLIIHRQFDIKRQLYFKIKDVDNLCDIVLPNQISIQIKELNIKSIFEFPPKEESLKEFYDYLYQFEDFFNSNIQKFWGNNVIRTLFRFIKSLYFNFVYNASLYEYFFKFEALRPKLPKIEGKDKNEIKIILESIFNNLYSEVYQGNSNNTPGNIKIQYDELLKNSLTFIQIFWNLINKEKIENDQIFISSIQREFELLKNLINCYISTYPNLSYFDFEWINLELKDSYSLSSGELAKLNFYSRFFDVIRGSIGEFTVNKFDKLESNILILIDEGDLFYHPQWQKNFLFDMISHLPKIFSKINHSEIKLQIILTSNSPFIASDLPKENIVFLKRIGGKIETTNLEDQKLTFAANIHTLFTDSFFVKDGLIGNFAKSKIDDAIETLYKIDINDLTDEKINEIRIVIEMIGEPVIKSRMLQMLEDKVKSNLFDIDKRLRKVEEDINQINRRTKE